MKSLIKKLYWVSCLVITVLLADTGGVLDEVSLTLTGVPAVKEKPGLDQTLTFPSFSLVASEKAREVLPTVRVRVLVSAAVITLSRPNHKVPSPRRTKSVMM